MSEGSRNSGDLLAIAAVDQTSTTSMFCPGELTPVSRAVHLARLRAGWPGCDRCRWREETQGLSSVASRRAATIRGFRVPGIRRTAMGIRGAWQNELDRFQAAQIAQIFTTHLASLCFNHQSEPTAVDSTIDDPDGRERPMVTNPDLELCGAVRIVAGFDGRQSAMDIFSGVVSAACQNGCDVIDIGRCSYSSLHEALRSDGAACAAIYVTGAGGLAGEIGLDVFDKRFEAVSVPWHKYGVNVITESAGNHAMATTEVVQGAQKSERSSAIDDALRMIRSHGNESSMDPAEFLGQHESRDHDTDVSSEEGPMVNGQEFERHYLELPSAVDHAFGFRTVRTCGEHRSLDFEDRYRRWLRRWFPSGLSRPIVVAVHDSLMAERLYELYESLNAGSTMHIIETPLHTDRDRIDNDLRMHLTREGAYAGFVIPDDDRELVVFNRAGNRIAANELCEWINRATRSSASHVTAHTSSDGTRVSLLDVSRPGIEEPNEVICDSMAVMGLLLRLLQTRGNSFPV